MTNLLSANLLRLKKNILFWGLMIVSFCFGGFLVYAQVSDHINYDVVYNLDRTLFFYAEIIGLLAAVFISLFLGTEHSDGAIRNKVAVGHSRWQIYLANLLTCYAVSLLSTAANLLAVFGLGIPIMGAPGISPSAFLLCLLGSLVMEAAFCAVFTAVAMNFTKKAAAAVICILLFFAMLLASTYIYARLEAQEFIQGYALVDGELALTEPEPNPRYLQGIERAVYEFLWDFLPTGQGVQYAIQTVTHPVRLLLCSLGLTAAFTAAGAALFRRKDLK